ncbi:GNAT family N-acetyltransferase [Pseudonocardia sp. GCM10023141]|uniref:GNAT family N-acetyltransferase n=1 Tax=Pseudonocardia sp. GCM10023141 TaxID=3252653 RepID=UPI0036243A5C
MRIGPVEVKGHHILLRSPRFDDAAMWREARLRERARIEPWWASSSLSWDERHSDAMWVTSVIQLRREARAGRAMPLVVEIDGRVAGQLNLEWIAEHTATAELGIWVDSRWAGQGLSAVAAGMIIDYAVEELGLQRLIAPICEGNVAAAWGAVLIGMQREGTMAGFLEVAGERRNHDLWAITADKLPRGGLTAAMRATALRPRGARSTVPPPT